MRGWNDVFVKGRGQPLLPIGLRVVLLLCGVAVFADGTVRGADATESLLFTNSVLLTPARTNTENRVYRFAPLLVFETSATNLTGLSPTQQFGLLEEVGGSLRVNTQRPAIYARNDVVLFNGQPCERYSYFWWRASIASNAPAIVQGLRITATPGGQSLVFEIVDAAVGFHQVVVSRSLEEAAWREFRGPLPGRRYAVEGGIGDGTATLVSRVIEDGPLELGPVVYLCADGGVGTVICRCMPAQTRFIAATGCYDLVEWTGESSELLERAGRQWGMRPIWRTSLATNQPGLERLLRLPGRLPGLPVSQ